MFDLWGRLPPCRSLLPSAIDERTVRIDELRNPTSVPTLFQAALTISGGSFNQNINGTKTG
jgi:hypothetical protein